MKKKNLGQQQQALYPRWCSTNLQNLLWLFDHNLLPTERLSEELNPWQDHYRILLAL